MKKENTPKATSNKVTAVASGAELKTLVNSVIALIHKHHNIALQYVNKEKLELYWEIGEEIARRQAERGWGDGVVEELADELEKEFPGERGYSARNLWLIRAFYVENATAQILQTPFAELDGNKGNEILQTLFAEMKKRNTRAELPPLLSKISWSHNLIIMQKCKDKASREFYVKMAVKFGWSHSMLVNHIECKSFEKFLLNQTNFSATVPEKHQAQACLAVKDDYNFDFLELSDEHSEKELEFAIIKNIRAFLAEMGGDFSFIGNQFHLNCAGDDYYIDLLLYHRTLRSLVAIDLKVTEFKPEYVGKMQFYLTALDENVKKSDENPSIGIIVCKNKNRTRVEYTLRTSTMPIGVATYSYYDTLPEGLKKLLPSPEEIEKIVSSLE